MDLREVLLNRLPQLQMPTLIVCETEIGCFRTLRCKRRSPSCKMASSNLCLIAVPYLTSSALSGSYFLGGFLSGQQPR